MANFQPRNILRASFIFVFCRPLVVAAFPQLFPRAENSTREARRGDIDISDFPACARTLCVTSGQFSPSRLGCISGSLDRDCLCEQAPSPLECAATFPRDDENCWYDLEDWLSATCNGTLRVLNLSAMPACMERCTAANLGVLGCRSLTQACFCSLTEEDIAKAVEPCFTHVECGADGLSEEELKDAFDPKDWRHSECNVAGQRNLTLDGDARIAKNEENRKEKERKRKKKRDLGLGLGFGLGLPIILITIIVIATN